MGLSDWKLKLQRSNLGKDLRNSTEPSSNSQDIDVHIFVSVVIITRNRSDLLYDSIRSVLIQTYSNFELLIIDDGSEDNTEEMVKQFPDSRIRYVKKKPTGIPKSRNIGVQMAKGEYIVIMDDDDLMMPNRIQEQIECLSDGSSGSYGGWIDQDAESNLEYNSGGEYGYSQILFGGKIMLHPASMIKRSVLLQFPYDENYSFGTDYVMNLEIARAGHKLDHTGSYILLRRFHGRNVTLTNTGEQKNTAKVRKSEFLESLDEETEKRMRQEWKNTPVFQRHIQARQENYRSFVPLAVSTGPTFSKNGTNKRFSV
jgi:glycosyltransferase involved in cell wall biosynthesis